MSMWAGLRAPVGGGGGDVDGYVRGYVSDCGVGESERGPDWAPVPARTHWQLINDQSLRLANPA